MKKLLMSNGKSKLFKQVATKMFILSGDAADWDLGKAAYVFLELNECAVLLGYMDFERVNILELSAIYCEVEKRKKEILTTLQKENLKYAHEIYKCDMFYFVHVYGATQQEYMSFVEYYEAELDKAEAERSKRIIEANEKERLYEIARIDSIKKNILNDSAISGRNLLDVMNDIDYPCPIRTKGFINKCNNIKEDYAELLPHVTKFSQSAVNNLFMHYRNVKNYISENIEYKNMSDEDRREVEELFTK